MNKNAPLIGFAVIVLGIVVAIVGVTYQHHASEGINSNNIPAVPKIIGASESDDLITPSPTLTVSPTISVSNTSGDTSPSVTPQTNVIAGISVFTDKARYKVGDEVIFGITNNLEVPLQFAVGHPFWIQYYQIDGTWKNLTLGGGTQAFWHLQPGETETWPWRVTGLYDYDYVYGNNKPFTIIPGVYRVIIFGEFESEEYTKFALQKEFIFE